MHVENENTFHGVYILNSKFFCRWADQLSSNKKGHISVKIPKRLLLVNRVSNQYGVETPMS